MKDDNSVSGIGVNHAMLNKTRFGRHHRWYPNYVLGMLSLAYVFNFIDRNILSVLVEPIKKDLGISDAQIGLLGGLSFALVYCVSGIPVARWADRGSRINIISLGVAVWSVMTMLCGFAKSFSHLLLARIGVGIGEAACTPPSHSLISDYFPPGKRATALGIYSMGGPIGVSIGFIVGGWIEFYFDWRMAFVVVGVPGVLLALFMRLSIAEPIRGRFDSTINDEYRLSFIDVLKQLVGIRSFVYLQLANILFSFAGYSLAFWTIPFFVRAHGLLLREVATYMAIIGLVGGIAGSYFGGRIADIFSRRNSAWYFGIPAISLVLASAGSLWMLSATTALFALAGYFISALFMHAYSGPIFASIQAMVDVRIRSQAVAVHLLLSSLLGMGLGPMVVGGLSDYFVTSGLNGGSSLRQALIAVVVFMLAAAFSLAAGARNIHRDIKS
jgi:MFS family permease